MLKEIKKKDLFDLDAGNSLTRDLTAMATAWLYKVMTMSTLVHSSRPSSETKTHHHGSSSCVHIWIDNDGRTNCGSGSSATNTRELRESYISSPRILLLKIPL